MRLQEHAENVGANTRTWARVQKYDPENKTFSRRTQFPRIKRLILDGTAFFARLERFVLIKRTSALNTGKPGRMLIFLSIL